MLTMWDSSGEPPGEEEGKSSDSVMQTKEKLEEEKCQAESLEDIVLKPKSSSKKQEEVQEYARRLSKLKSRAKLLRKNKEGKFPSKDKSHTSDATVADTSEQTIDDISQAKTAKAKSTLLQKKLAEDRKVFEQRNKERTETKRAVEEKVEAIRQQLEEKDVSNTDLALINVQKDQPPITSIKPVVITSEVMSPIQIESIREKESKISELSNKILELEATIIDLQENLKEKDSVIESKTKAVTLMSADLSLKGKTTLDTLEDTKDEMRTMQEHFVLLETSLKSKNENLLSQLQERDNKITELEESVKRFEEEVDKQKLAESASADFSRSTMDTLVETKEAMKSMQENFVLIESSLKTKNDSLLQQLQDYELKLAEANERVFKLESGIGIQRDPSVDDLQFKLEKLEHSNKKLQDEKYDLQKSIVELQDKIVNLSGHGNSTLVEKDNRIVELENLVEELKQSNKLLEEESKEELQKLVADLTLKNEEFVNKITDLRNLVHKLEKENSDIAAKLPDENAVSEDEKVAKLTKELEDLNKTMIKIKAQHKTKVKNLQKQLEGFKMVSDTNAELVRLANQVALLEEEKGNLQLNLVDFDELKASAGDWQEQIVYLESKVSDQSKEIQMQIEAIAALENQKLDLMQELHMAKQEISSLEAENAESENLRVTAEMKVVEFEEQLEAMQKLENDNKSSQEESHAKLIRQIEDLTQENTELHSRIGKMEEKGAYDSGSTESFEAIQELDRSDLLKKVEDLLQKNNELTNKLSKLHEKGNSHAGSTESFETIHDTDKNELLKKIDQLTQENSDLTMKLSRLEEKGSSDTGSTESFERIPEHNESVTKIDLLTQENSELVIKLTKLEEQLEHLESSRKESKSDIDVKSKVDSLLEENNNQFVELSNLRAQLLEVTIENTNLQKQVENLTAEMSVTQSEDSSDRLKRDIDFTTQIDELLEEKVHLEKEIKELRNELEKSREVTVQDHETNNLKSRIENLLKENEQILLRMSELETFNEKLKGDLTTVNSEKDELYIEINQMLPEEPVNDKSGFLEKLGKLLKEKQQLNEQVEILLEKSAKESENRAADEFENKLENQERELEEKDKQVSDYQAFELKIESLESELKEMQEKVNRLLIEKASIEEEFNRLEKESSVLIEEKKMKDEENNLLKQQLQDTVSSYELQIQEKLAAISEKEREIVNLKEVIEEKDQELHAKYTELQNKMIAIDSLQDELNNFKTLVQEKAALLSSSSEEILDLNNAVRNKDEELFALRKDVIELNNKMEEYKPLKDYNELLEQLKNKDMILDEAQYRINAIAKENDNLLQEVKKWTQQNDDIEQRLNEKQQECSQLLVTKERLDAEIADLKNAKEQDEKRIWEIQNIIDLNANFVDDLQAELRGAYKQIEQLKLKHTEDMQLQNQRIENLIKDLQSKTQECEMLNSELLEKQRLVGQNVTEEIKVALEAKVAELEQKLKDSEDKIQMQLEKMKKIAANLKKKSAVCQELETRVTELEEKWTTEKDEKEAKNKQIQDVEISMREKDNQIADLEKKLIQARSESAEAFANVDKLTSDLSNSKEKMSLLAQQFTEMEEEIVKLRADLDSSASELATERNMKQDVTLEYEGYREQIAKENEHKQVELDEVKEKARELSVRMQVMEAEYVEQLALIKNLIAENALLSSKQTQISEKLENVEKESEQRRVLLEQMQREAVSSVTATTQTVDEEAVEEDAKISDSQHCNHCEQCQTVVQALEAKLQEREAEIENLDNELANSIGNFVQMRESLRYNDMMNQTAMRNRSLEDPYNDLLFQYNALVSSNEEVKVKLEEASKQNKDLAEAIEGLQSAKTSLEEKIMAAEQALQETRLNTEKLENVDSLNSDLLKKCEDSEAKLLNVHQEMQAVRERADLLEEQLSSQTALLMSEGEQRIQAEKQLEDMKSNVEQEIESLKADKAACERTIEDLKIELETYQNQSERFEKSTIKKESPTFDFPTNEADNAPQLFDASKIFGAASSFGPSPLDDSEVLKLQALLNEKEAQCSNLTQEINDLQKQMIEERETSRKELHVAQTNHERAEEFLTESKREVESLNDEMQNYMLQIRQAMGSIEKLSSERDQQTALLESYKLRMADLEGQLGNSTDSELIQDLEARVSNITKERDLLQLQMSDLSRSLEELKDANEIGKRLQTEIERTARERDEAKELAANLTRALEDARETAARTTAVADSFAKESAFAEESLATRADSDTSKTTTDNLKETTPSDTWDTGSTEKLNVDEETWGWNPEDAELAGEQQVTALIPSTEIQLQAKMEDLEDRIKDLEKERDKLTEENKHVQLRSGKMIKKLKEYKVQVENLQQQLKIQKSTSDFYELDSAIEEELKSQISRLEKALNENREEQKSMAAEKEALTKRLDVVLSANERYMEMKERQDMDMEVLRIRNKELSDKVETLDRRLQEGAAVVEESDASRNEGSVAPLEEAKPVDRPKRSVDGEDLEARCKKYKDEVDDLKDEMEALATENEQLQQVLGELKNKLSALESKRTADENESIQIVDDLNKKISELQGMLSKTREEYELLRKQYEQSLMDANDQVSVMRQNADFLKEETFEKISNLEAKIADLLRQIEASEANGNSLQQSLEEALKEKARLEDHCSALVASSEKQLSGMSASMAEVTELLNVRIQEVADLKQELQRQYVDHEGVKMQLQDSMQQLNLELAEKRQQVESLKKSLLDKENEVVQQQSVEMVSALVSQATQELVQKHAIEIEKKEKEVRQLTERISALEATANNCLLEKESSTGQFEAQRQELERLRSELAEKESIQGSLQQSLTSLKEQLSVKESQVSENEETVRVLSVQNKEYMEAVGDLQKRLNETETLSSSVQDYVSRVQSLEHDLEVTKASLVETETALRNSTQETATCMASLEKDRAEMNELRAEVQKADALRNELLQKTEQINHLSLELEAANDTLNEARQSLNDTVSSLEASNRALAEKQMELERLSAAPRQSPSEIDGLPVFRMADDTQSLQRTIDAMQAELDRKQGEIDNLKHILDENTYPSILQEMQDKMNVLYNERAELEAALRTAELRIAEKDKQLDALTQRMEAPCREELVSKEEASMSAKSRRSAEDQEEIVRLQNELHTKEQEINELKYVIAEKDSQLSLQASMEPQSDDFELREMVQRLTAELYAKEQEIQHLKTIITGLEQEVSQLRELERLSEETRNAIEKLSVEKEQVRVQAQEFLEQKLREKEMEINEVKERLSIENRNILSELQLRDRDIENLRKQLVDSSTVGQRLTDDLHQKEELIVQVNADLAEKERRLAELSITKDAELHNLKVQIHEKEVRIEELSALFDEEQKQLRDLKNTLEARETEINSLKTLLEDKVKEYEMIQNVLKKDVSIMDTSAVRNPEASSEQNSTSTSQELDLALYMLHQRDVRCEELTHELMQLLEERDTLQLRLSNAIRVNEELRKGSNPDLSLTQEPSISGTTEPHVEHPSPSKSEGPVEIAKEAIDAPIGEDKETLALKLSQLHTVSHAKDVRLRDERELRHTQQMSLLAHKDVLSTLPPEAAARLVNANYTLSRDVQSQSSVLLNWLWGKSTPKVVHM
nr:golgin subfamily A member 4-like isoform X2 [Nomia melanderi]